MRDGDQLNAIRSGIMGPDEYRVSNMPRLGVTMTANQVITSGVTTVVAWDGLAYDTDSMWDATNHRAKVGSPGVYLVTADVGFAANAAGYRQASFGRNNVTAPFYANTVFYDRDAVSVNTTITCILALNRGDTLDVRVAQTSGGNLNFVGGTSVGFQMCLVSTL